MNNHEPLLYQLMSCIYDTPPDVIDQMINQPYEMFLVYAAEQLEVQENSRRTHAHVCTTVMWPVEAAILMGVVV